MNHDDETRRIRALNDALRVGGVGGRIVFAGILAQQDPVQQFNVWNAVRNFSAFNEDNDPHGEHDFVSVMVSGETYFGKIDYYDKALEYGSPDPADPGVTTRVLTIFHSSDY